MNAVRLPRRGPRSPLALASHASGVVAFGWPLLASPGSGLAHSGDAPLAVRCCCCRCSLAVVLAELADGGLDAKAVAMLGVLAAVGAALRPLGGGVTGLHAGVPADRPRRPGARPRLRLRARRRHAVRSALLTGGVGPWLPFQMLGAAWVGLLAGCLPPATGRREVWLVAAYGAFAGLAYGFLINLWFWPFATGLSSSALLRRRRPDQREPAPVPRVLRDHVAWASTSRGRSATSSCCWPSAARSCAPCRRAARRAAFDVPVEFEPVAELMEVVLLGTGSADGWPNAFCTLRVLQRRTRRRPAPRRRRPPWSTTSCCWTAGPKRQPPQREPAVPWPASAMSCSPTPTSITRRRRRCCGDRGRSGVSR